MELNREQIVKALECHANDQDCAECPYTDKSECHTKIAKDALFLIKELTEENERLSKYEITYQTPLGERTMPNLLSLDGDAAELYKQIEAKIVADTVREM